jgi:hypothetical protein
VRKLRTATAVLAALLLLGVAAGVADSAQVLRGRVVDENGLPVGGAQVKLEHAGGQTFSAVSDDTGFFSIANLVAGEYTARVIKPGFFVLADQKIQLTADSSEFEFTLNHEQEVHEKVDVTVSSNTIEPSETAQTGTLTAAEIRDIPVPSTHNLEQSLIALPLVLRDNLNLLHIAGARTTEAQYLLNGFDISDPANGAPLITFSVDAVRTAEVQTSRFGAEYAHPAAAILAFNTPDGDDRWRFNTTDFIPAINIDNGWQLGNFYPRVFISGPIKREHLWFSQAFSVQHTLSIEKGLPSSQDQIQLWSGSSLSRLLWRVAANHSLQLSFLYNGASDSYVGLDALHPQSTTVNTSAQEYFGSVKDQIWAHDTLCEFGFAAHQSFNNTTPQGSAPYILLVNGAEGNYYQEIQPQGRRYQLFANVTSTSLHWHGAHIISGGADLSNVRLIQSAARTEIQALRSNLTLDRLTTFSGSGDFRLSDTLAGGYVQDTWTPNRHVVAKIGVSADWDRLIQSAIAEPRLSVNILPFEDNRGKFSIGWGMYDIPLNLSVIGQTQDEAQVDTFYNASGTAPIAGPATSHFLLPAGGLPGGLKVPYFDIAGAGWEQRFGANTIVSIQLLARNEHHGLVYETLSPGHIGSDFRLQTTRQDKYRAITLSARHTFANTAELFGSYTRSRANTNQDLDPFLGNLYFAPQQPGPLSWDAPNRFLTWGSTPTSLWELFFSYLMEYRTGYPFSVINQQQFLIGPPNSHRFPDYFNLTLALEKKFRFSHRVFAIRVAAINILNRENPDVVVNNIDAPNYLTFSGGQGRAITARLRFVGRK